MKVEIGDATLYLGDCLEILPTIAPDVIIADPIWPNAPEGMFVATDHTPHQLLTCTLQNVDCKRIAIILRADSDPRFLTAVPARYPFFCAQWMQYVMPGFVGRTLGGNEIVYGFGEPIKFAKGRQLIPGMAPKAQPGRQGIDHPCPRNIEHMKFVVNWWSDFGETVVDPFMGSGTTGVACTHLTRKFIGIEIEPKYFDIACSRIEHAYSQPRLFNDERMPEVRAEQAQIEL